MTNIIFSYVYIENPYMIKSNAYYELCKRLFLFWIKFIYLLTAFIKQFLKIYLTKWH